MEAEGAPQVGRQALNGGGIAVVGQGGGGDQIDVIADVGQHVGDVEDNGVVRRASTGLKLYESVVGNLFVERIVGKHIPGSGQNGLFLLIFGVGIGAHLADDTSTFCLDDDGLEEGIRLVKLPIVGLHHRTVAASDIGRTGQHAIRRERMEILIVMQ